MRNSAVPLFPPSGAAPGGGEARDGLPLRFSADGGESAPAAGDGDRDLTPDFFSGVPESKRPMDSSQNLVGIRLSFLAYVARTAASPEPSSSFLQRVIGLGLGLGL